MQAIPREKRLAVLADCDGGMGTLAVAIKHRVSESWVRRLKQRRRETGEIDARPPIKKTPPRWRAYAAQMQAIVTERPDITLRELREELGVDFSLQILSAALRTLKYTFKKKSSMRPSRTGPMSPRGGRRSASSRRASTSATSSSSTKRGPKPT
jgi:transposase